MAGGALAIALAWELEMAELPKHIQHIWSLLSVYPADPLTVTYSLRPLILSPQHARAKRSGGGVIYYCITYNLASRSGAAYLVA